MYALILKFVDNKTIIDEIIERSEILKTETRLSKYMCYVLMTELLFGVKQLNGESKPVQCVRSYHDKFLEILAELKSSNAVNNTQGNFKNKAFLTFPLLFQFQKYSSNFVFILFAKRNGQRKENGNTTRTRYH